METDMIDKTCSLCGDDANAVIKTGKNTLELCSSCAKDLFWELSHHAYAFEDDDD